jgi:triosephosphate isomerase (TIM)
LAKIVAANWKMNLRRQSAVELAATLKSERRKCWLFPAFPLIVPVADTLIGSRMRLGAQDVSALPDGAHTGEVSAELLASLGCELVLIGHSERRQSGDENALLTRKLKRAHEAGLYPVFCVGETADERKAGKALQVVRRQLEALGNVRPEAVAYEPVWAIGTGDNATPAQANEMHAMIKGELKRLKLTAPVIYGGSVRPDNARELMAQPQVDGVLVGGASLEYESLTAIDDAALES